MAIECSELQQLNVRGLEREEVSQVDGPSSADRRRLWLFCVAQREALEAAVADASAFLVARVAEACCAAAVAATPVSARNLFAASTASSSLVIVSASSPV